MLPHYAGFKSERLTLTTGKGEKEKVQYASGLDWGQRPCRNQDQAYLSIAAPLQRSDFFPVPGVVFCITTDDSHEWICARRQANDKALNTFKDDSIIGSYFIKRLGLKSGDSITLSHLIRYGRTSVEVLKIDELSYVLDSQQYK